MGGRDDGDCQHQDPGHRPASLNAPDPEAAIGNQRIAGDFSGGNCHNVGETRDHSRRGLVKGYVVAQLVVACGYRPRNKQSRFSKQCCGPRRRQRPGSRYPGRGRGQASDYHAAVLPSPNFAKFILSPGIDRAVFYGKAVEFAGGNGGDAA